MADKVSYKPGDVVTLPDYPTNGGPADAGAVSDPGKQPAYSTSLSTNEIPYN